MPGQWQLKMRYVPVVGGKLGSGQFGTVYKAINVDSGKCMAVKILELPIRVLKQEDWRKSLYYALKRKVETVSEISHISKSSLTSLYETDIYTRYISSIISHYKAGTVYRWRYLWA
jgi:serine/threonine protein kinase